MGNWCATVVLGALGVYYARTAAKGDSGISRVVGVLCGMALVGAACLNFVLGIGAGFR